MDCFWTQLESLPGDQYLISKYDATNNKRSFALSVDSSGYISHTIGTGSGSSAETNTSATALSTGTWYHVGATFDDSDKSWSLRVWDYDAASVVIDMNGVNTNNINIEDANWVIGATDDGAGYFDGLMDEVVVFKDILSSDEIDEIRAGVYTVAPWSGIVYTYDPAGRRINKNVDNVDTSFTYDGGHCIAEYDESGDNLRKYIYGLGVDSPILMIEVQDANAQYYYHRDGLGNVVALSNADGNTVQTYDYSIYGLPAASDANHPNPYLFTGRRFDFETGLYYYRARMYHPNIGRFLQTDPIGYGDGMNWYAYCGNNPANCTDPTGMHDVLHPPVGRPGGSIGPAGITNPLQYYYHYLFGNGAEWNLNERDPYLLSSVENDPYYVARGRHSVFHEIYEDIDTLWVNPSWWNLNVPYGDFIEEGESKEFLINRTSYIPYAYESDPDNTHLYGGYTPYYEALGDGRVLVDIEIIGEFTKGSSSITWVITFNMYYTIVPDELYRMPALIGWPGVVRWIFGEPFPITGTWEESYSMMISYSWADLTWMFIPFW